MRKLSAILLFLISTQFYAQRCIRQSDKLIAAKKYRTAWETLDKADPKNKKPAIALAKTDLLLTYFINTVMHQVFTLKDLQPNEKVENLRGTDENGNLIRFDPEAVLDTLIKQNPDNYKLYEGLGNYYYQVFIVFQENWLKKPEELVHLIHDNYSKSYAHGLKTYLAAYRIGFSELFLQQFPDARKSFQESITLNPKYPDAYYSLAYCSLQLGLADSALWSANKAYELFTDTFNRSDVNLLRGMIYSSKKDTLASLREYTAAAALNPKSQSMSQLLLKAELRYDGKDVDAVSSSYFDLGPRDAETYNELITDYFNANKPKEVLAFLERKLTQYTADPEITGNICFYRAYVYVVMEEKEKAKADLLRAKADFSKVFPPGHQMFGTIDEAMKELEK
jgi:tetratricopeptide (TPR) repeat protein